MKWKTALETLGWLCFAGGMWAYSYSFDTGYNVYELGIAHWPRAVLIFMIVTVLLHCAESYFQNSKNTKITSVGDQASELNKPLQTEDVSSYRIRVGFTFVLPVIYLWLIPRAGYFITTPFFLGGYIYLFGQRKLRQVFVPTIIVYLFLLLIFSKALYVPLPTGNWPVYYDLSNSILVFLGSG